MADSGAAETALQQLRPLLRPESEQKARVILQRTVSKYHSGPIPSAEEMEHLEQIHAGAADRCFRMAEREQEHRHACERDVISKEFSFRGRAQHYALATVIVLLAAVAYLAFLGDTKSAASLGSVTLVGLVAAWTASKYIENNNDQPSEPTKSDSPKGKKRAG